MLTTRKIYGTCDREEAQNLADEWQRPVSAYTLGEPSRLVLRVRPRYRYLADVLKRNAAAGQHYFEPGTMRFFKSRVLSGVHLAKGGRLAYFVTSENGPNGIRAYSVRLAQPDGSIDTVGEFQGYRTARAARRAADLAAEGRS